ncbi:hypothetical protein MKW98_010019 [Papaver atlanticum]|uniref:Uncharacterized protein n=1 Tax=Papaver atlanticum TaxID=357466 RepID=A0AAD4X478_9MAGN|nr:hypothetical protein MKW98_010019 [Papaver atlanticum]
MSSADPLDLDSQSPWPPTCPEGQHECREDDIYKGKLCSSDDLCLCINCCINPTICEKCPDPHVLPPPPSPPSHKPPPPTLDISDLPPPPPPRCPEREPWRNNLCTELDEKFKFPTTKPCVKACETGCDCLCEAMGSSVVDQYCIKQASKLHSCRCCCKDITGVEPLQSSDNEGESDADELQLNKDENLQS